MPEHGMRNSPPCRHAIAVHITGHHVGYLSAEDAPRFRRRLKAKGLTGLTTSCDAIIVGGYKMRDGNRAFLGVQLDLRPFD